jgi:hypothetical protein
LGHPLEEAPAAWVGQRQVDEIDKSLVDVVFGDRRSNAINVGNGHGGSGFEEWMHSDPP